MNVDFYFYYGCPWTYLAFSRLREVAMRTGATITWKPILVDRVQARLAGGAAAGHAQAVPAKARYQAKDLADWAAFCGLEIRHPGPFPLPAQWAVRGAVVANAAAVVPAYSEAVFSACFRDRQDIASFDVVARLARQAGLEPQLAQTISDDRTLQAVEDNSMELVERGGFGSPTMFVGDDMYFGNDRMTLVEFALSRAPELRVVVPGAHGQL
jgi:2-hydroxychromene-2-carboxylate isomerase